jgi:hypothetical protein
MVGMSVRCGLGAGTYTDVLFRMAALLNSRLDELTMPKMTSGAALALSSAAIGSYVSLGFHCIHMVIAPTPCGTAIDVPCRMNVFVVDIKVASLAKPYVTPPTVPEMWVPCPLSSLHGTLSGFPPLSNQLKPQRDRDVAPLLIPVSKMYNEEYLLILIRDRVF